MESRKETWPAVCSLALAGILYEAVGPERPTCLYAHHDLEFPGNLEYLEELKRCGFAAQVVRPFLEYFDLMDRGIGFLAPRYRGGTMR
jgi:hypothetical protein